MPLQTPQDLINMDKDADPKTQIRRQILNIVGVPYPVRGDRSPYYSRVFQPYDAKDELRPDPVPGLFIPGYMHQIGPKQFDSNPFHP